MVKKHEGSEGYLWVVSVDAGVAGEGPATEAVPRAAMAVALSPPARQVDNGAAMGGFSRVG